MAVVGVVAEVYSLNRFPSARALFFVAIHACLLGCLRGILPAMLFVLGVATTSMSL
jgi:hypothetical protein